MKSHYRQIVSAVQRVRWVQRLVGLLEGLLVFWSGLMVCLLGLTLLAGPLSGHAAWRALALPIGLIVPGLAAAAWWLRTPSLRQSQGQCALAIERASGRAHNEVINALQLGREAMSPSIAVSGVTARLVARLVRGVGEELPRGATLQSVDGTRLRRLELVLLAVAFTAGVAWLTAPDAVNQAWLALLRPWDEVQGLGSPRPSEPPSVGDIKLTYHYPLYTGLRPRVVLNGSGHIAALKGADVQIQATANARLRSARMILSSGQTAPLHLSHPEESQDERATLSGRIVVVEHDSYRFKLLPQDAPAVVCPDLYSITAEDDAAPQVEITDDAASDSAHPAKVAARGSVEVPYRASDDFGLAKVRLVFERAGKEKKVSLRHFTAPRKRYSDTYKWDLAGLELQPGERIAYRVEAEDNDSVSGPNVGRSRMRFIEVFSARKKHRAIVELQDALKKAMVNLLADQLEMPVADPQYAKSPERLLMAQENIGSARKAVLHFMRDIADLMRQDSLSNYAYFQAIENMASRLRGLSSRRDMAIAVLRRALGQRRLLRHAVAKLADVQEDEIRELELDLIFLDDILQQQRLADIHTRADELLSLQRDIADLLEQLASKPDPDVEKQAQALLAQIQRMLAEMMAQMEKMAPHLPQEFVNADAQAHALGRDMAEALKRMMEAMNRGDTKAALDAARQLMQHLSKMMDSWRKSSQAYGKSRYGEQLRQLKEMHSELSDLEQRERRLAQRTNEIRRAAQRRIFQLRKQSLDAFFKKQLERLAQVEQALAELKQHALTDPEIKRYRAVFESYRAQIHSQLRIGREVQAAKDSAKKDGLMRALRSAEQRMLDLARAVSNRPVLRVLCDVSRELGANSNLVVKLRQTLEAWDAGESLPLAERLETQTRRWRLQVQSASHGPSVGQVDKAHAELVMPPLRTAEKASHEIAEALRELRASLDALRQQTLTEEEAAQLERLAEEQGQVQQRTEALRRRADQAAATMPFMSPKTGRRLAGAAKSMQRAGQKLRASQLGQALAEERDAAAQLAQAKKMMEDAQQMCQQGMMAGSMSMPTNLRRGGAGSRPDLQKVEIPSEDAHRVPRRFRQEIIDAAKQGMPKRFQDINREYYRKLLE